MNILHQIIGELSKEEVRHFKLYLTQTNAGALRKDVALFDAIRKNFTDFDEDKFHKKHYSNEILICFILILMTQFCCYTILFCRAFISGNKTLK